MQKHKSNKVMYWLINKNVVPKESQKPSSVFPVGAIIPSFLIHYSQLLYRKELRMRIDYMCVNTCCICVCTTHKHTHTLSRVGLLSLSPIRKFIGWENLPWCRAGTDWRRGDVNKVKLCFLSFLIYLFLFYVILSSHKHLSGTLTKIFSSINGC